jgi:hypothetical protein
MKAFYSIFLLILSTTLISFTHAQGVESQGWKGTPIIPVSDFVNPASWHPNHSAGDECFVTTDNRSIQLHWKFNPGTGHRYAQIYFVFDNPISLANLDIVGIDIKGQHINNDCGEFNIQLKLENLVSSSNTTCKWNNLARINRWCENISKIKNQFSNPAFNWEQVKVVSLEIFTDLSIDSPIEGVVCFRNLAYDHIGNWSRALDFDSINNSNDELNEIKRIMLDTITNRQASTGLLTTWREDGSSWLYGQGLALKILSLEGSWKAESGDSVRCKDAATKLANFLVGQQNPMGFWPRAWRAKSGNEIVNLEDDGSVWFGDFPWMIIGLQNYYKKSCDSTVLPAIEKARHFLTDSLIDPNGKLYTIKKYGQSFRKLPVTSVEAYSAVILSLLEIGEKEKAIALATYIDSLIWDDSLKYWKEGIYSTRVVLFGNTWFSDLIRNNHCIAEAVDPTLQKSKDALSLVGKILYTSGPGSPVGFDGIGPVATWLEGTFSYICAGGTGSQTVFDSLMKSIEPGYGVLHYNDKVGCNIGGIWAEKWISLDGTSWLYFTASKSSPFKIVHDSSAIIPANKIEILNHSFSLFPNPVSQILTIQVPQVEKGNTLMLLDISGNEHINRIITESEIKLNVANFANGIYFVKFLNTSSILVKKIIIEH